MDLQNFSTKLFLTSCTSTGENAFILTHTSREFFFKQLSFWDGLSWKQLSGEEKFYIPQLYWSPQKLAVFSTRKSLIKLVQLKTNHKHGFLYCILGHNYLSHQIISILWSRKNMQINHRHKKGLHFKHLLWFCYCFMISNLYCWKPQEV